MEEDLVENDDETKNGEEDVVENDDEIKNKEKDVVCGVLIPFFLRRSYFLALRPR